MTNLPTLDDIIRNPAAGQGLPIEHAAGLIEQAKQQSKVFAAAGKLVESDIAERYASQIGAAYQAEHKDTGTVHVDADGFDLAADRPKKVEWDQAALKAVVDRIRAAGDDPAEYVDIAFAVPERKYTAWPEHIRTQFEAARTVRPGALTIKLVPPVAQQKAAA